MRELAKSVIGYSWAASLFGVQQAFNMLKPPVQGQPHPATKAFSDMSSATIGQLQEPLKSAFNAGVTMQGQVVDVFFGMLRPDGWMAVGSRIMGQAASTASGTAQSAAGAAQAAAGGTTGFGPMPK